MPKNVRPQTVLDLIGGLKGYSPADAVQDFKNAPKYVLKYGDTTHIGTNAGKTR